MTAAADFFNAILVLFRMITGENWNNVMHDSAIESPYCVANNSNFLASDCGSPSWYGKARPVLFLMPGELIPGGMCACPPRVAPRERRAGATSSF